MLHVLSQTMLGFVRKMVSGRRTRYQADGYDLDLCYVTPRVVAMGCARLAAAKSHGWSGQLACGQMPELGLS